MVPSYTATVVPFCSAIDSLTSDDGSSLIGRVLDAEQVSAVRASFGLDGGPAMTGPEAFEAVMKRGNALALANGWRLGRRRVMGGNRV